MNRRLKLSFVVLIFMLGSQFFLGPVQAATLSSQEVERACLRYLLERTGHRENGIFFNLLREIPPLAVPQGKTDLVVSGDVEKGELGRISLTVTVMINDVSYKDIYVLCKLDAKEVAYLAIRWIRRGELLSAEDFSVAEMARSELPPRAVREEKQFLGMAAKVALPQGRILTDLHFEAPALIKRKQPVIMIAEKDGVKIETRGIALMDGCRGESIKVKNRDSGKTVYGEVIDENRVAVTVP